MNMESNIYKAARMTRWLAVLGMAVVVVLAAGCDLFREPAEPTQHFTPMPTQTTGAPMPTQTPTKTTEVPMQAPTQTAFEEINFTSVTTLTSLPSQVQIVFSLRDQNGHSIVLPAEEIKNAARVYERGETDDDWEEIDYSETSFFVHTAENFQLEVVFVLDFTNSMAQATLPDGGSGIDAMMSAFESAALSLPETHRIGVVEFHDRNVEPVVLSPLTTDRDAVLSSVRQFVESGFDHGSSRVWDSVVVGSDLFSRGTGVVRGLVFLSDGRDTSSVNTREQAARYAGESGVQLYAMGVGEVHQEDELRDAVLSTGGSYYPARELAGLGDQLSVIASDLRGQYKLSYITLRRTGVWQARLSVVLRGAEGDFRTDTFDAARFFGPDNRGVVRFDPPSLDRAAGTATLFMRALHVPRNIDRIRFKLNTSKPAAVELVAGADGGLLGGWTLSGPDEGGFYEASSGEPIEFGNFGPLFRLTLSGVTEKRLRIPVAFDNSIYTGGKEFSHTSHITIGQPVKIYWIDVDSRKIQRANLDGSGVEDLVEGLDFPYDIALDVAAGQMYWTDFHTNKIQRANLDGSGVEDLVEGLNHPRDIALDVAAGQMYWTDFGITGTEKTKRANLDGSEVEDLFEGLDMRDIALDVAAGKMYWINSGITGTDKIWRANLDGSEVEDLVEGLAPIGAIALDVAAGKMYWTTLESRKIQRANLDGSEVEDLFEGLYYPYDIALDVAVGKIYWVDGGSGKMQRANLDGSGVEDLVEGLGAIRDIVLGLD